MAEEVHYTFNRGIPVLSEYPIQLEHQVSHNTADEFILAAYIYGIGGEGGVNL
jgi:hypothetical protein